MKYFHVPVDNSLPTKFDFFLKQIKAGVPTVSNQQTLIKTSELSRDTTTYWILNT